MAKSFKRLVEKLKGADPLKKSGAEVRPVPESAHKPAASVARLRELESQLEEAKGALREIENIGRLSRRRGRSSLVPEAQLGKARSTARRTLRSLEGR